MVEFVLLTTLLFLFPCCCQVMGVGHWGVVVFDHGGSWAISLVHNTFNPPRSRPRVGKEAVGGSSRSRDSDGGSRRGGSQGVDIHSGDGGGYVDDDNDDDDGDDDGLL